MLNKNAISYLNVGSYNFHIYKAYDIYYPFMRKKSTFGDTTFINNNRVQVFKRPARDTCLCMGDLQAPPAPHFVFLITL